MAGPLSERGERLLCGGAAALASLPTLHGAGFCLDDSYIHLAYVASLRLGEGLSYNPGDWETGVSSPLWVLLLAAWPPGVPGVLVVKTLGALLHVASAMLATTLARACVAAPAPGFALLAGLGVAATPLLVQGATSGMEVPLATALSLALSLSLVRAQYGRAALWSGLAYLARPELLAYAIALAVGLSVVRRDARALSAAAGALAGFVAYGVYCLSVSGHFFPNTYYVKSGELAASGLRYLFTEVSLVQPVVVSLTGLVLLGLGVRSALSPGSPAASTGREPAVPLILLSGCSTLVAIAVTRDLYPGVLFFQSRYFAVALWVLPLGAALGFARLPRGPAFALLAPLIATHGVLLWQNHALQVAQEQGVHRLHVEVAGRVIRDLPRDAVLGVEGAGALRFLTPRSIRVIDLEGLNDRRIAHLPPNLFLKFCDFRSRGGSHLAYPAQWRPKVHQAFVVQDLAHFTQPAYAQLDPPATWQVTLASIDRTRPDFAAYCRSEGR